MLCVVHGSNNEDAVARWEQAVASMMQTDAADAVRTANGQMQIMESWMALHPDELQVVASLKMPQYKMKIIMQRP